MSRKRTFATIAAFGLAVVASSGAAWYGAAYVETSSHEAVRQILARNDLGWAEVETDGLQLVLLGTAPDEPARFRAITSAGAVVDPGRIIDAMEVAERRTTLAPRFSLEILRNDRGVSVIGLVPAEGGAEVLDDALADAGGGTALEVTNMVETADYPVPPSWEETLRFALATLEDLPRSKVSVAPGRVTVTAVADSDDEKLRLERDLNRAKPDDLVLTLDIAAPRPVITPFTLRFIIPSQGAPRFDACAVDTAAAEARILSAARDAGFDGRANCVVALGVPSASWGVAAAEGIAALAEIGGGALTLSDADVSLVAREGTDRALFDTVVSELETALPDLFVLSAVLPEPTQIDGTGEGDTGTPEFVATLSPEGQVQLRGRLYDETQEAAVVSYGRALFGVSNTYIATREDASLPQGWPARVLAGMEALSRLESGSVVVQPELVVLRGLTGDKQAEARISGLLSDKLGAEADFRIDVRYDEELDPLLNIPTPEECETQLNAILVEQKLTFAPGEAVIEEAGDGQLGRLKEKLDECVRAVFEIGGHTDSQGREEMNLSLSQQRADAVRAALISRGVSPRQLVSEGYGETQPIADNDSEEGRETNRRITFTLLGRREVEPSPLDMLASPGEDLPADGEVVEAAPDTPVEDAPAEGAEAAPAGDTETSTPDAREGDGE
ncbi:OmpA family protein [Jannaschia sp. S6380]|uniref:OmpA family protein n=1 Tax=Jannaschia sp. S6380 TaxID=2926408 RepID=UPI001FF14C5E|nr:OmpA family protein [Jannaschia sp. S6380]MCK0169145.1 OmpA family protein [Jannaschia sp. S6380]